MSGRGSGWPELSQLCALLLLVAGEASAEGLLRVEDCVLVDDRAPVQATGVNYLDGFWRFSLDGDRQAYLPYLDALRDARVPFLRMSFGPWAPYRAERISAPAADFVRRRTLYFDRFDAFLADLAERRLGVVVNVFWNVEPYATAFGEDLAAPYRADSQTAGFLDETVAELARRHGRDPTIWALEFVNEGNLGIDFPRAPHKRAEFTALLTRLAAVARRAGDRHLVASGDTLPRPAAAHLHAGRGWTADAREEFLGALAAENPLPLASVHLYPDKPGARPWDGGDALATLPALAEHARRACQPVFVGEFGAIDPTLAQSYAARIASAGIPLAAAWGFGRPAFDPMAFDIDAAGRARLVRLGERR